MVGRVEEDCAAIATVVGVAVTINFEVGDPADGGRMGGVSSGAKIALTMQQCFYTGR